MAQLQLSPALIIAFARPDRLESLFYSIRRQNRFRRVYLSIDCASVSHPEKTKTLNERVREIALNLGSLENVVTMIRTSNLGTSQNLLLSLSKVFEVEDRVIVLEDDCLPTSHFFDFCDWGLTEFLDDPSVVAVQGANHFRWPFSSLRNYYLRYNLVHVWGWATWSQKWDDLDVGNSNQRTLNSAELDSILETNLPFNAYRTAWRKNLTFEGQISWDLRYQLSVWRTEKSVVCPGVNLVVNKGFDEVAVNSQELPDHFQNPLASAFRIPPSRLRVASGVLRLAELISFRIFAGTRLFWGNSVFRRNPKSKL